MIAPAPTIQPGQPCLIRIAVRVRSHGSEIQVDYMGTIFTVQSRIILLRLPDDMAVIEMPALVVKSTGRASYLVQISAYHSLRVHVQQIRLISEVAA